MKEGSHRAASSGANSFGSVRSSEGDMNMRRTGSVRDLPTKRNLQRELNKPADSRTGGGDKGDYGDVTSPNKQRHRPAEPQGKDLREALEQKREQDMRFEL